MRLMTDDLQNLSEEEIMAEMSRIQHVPDNKSLEALKLDLAALQRAMLYGMTTPQGYILFAMWIIYDPAVFFTEEECKTRHNINL